MGEFHSSMDFFFFRDQEGHWVRDRGITHSSNSGGRSRFHQEKYSIEPCLLYSSIAPKFTRVQFCTKKAVLILPFSRFNAYANSGPRCFLAIYQTRAFLLIQCIIPTNLPAIMNGYIHYKVSLSFACWWLPFATPVFKQPLIEPTGLTVPLFWKYHGWLAVKGGHLRTDSILHYFCYHLEQPCLDGKRKRKGNLRNFKSFKLLKENVWSFLSCAFRYLD